MFRRRNNIHYFILGLALCFNALALPTDEKQPATIKSDQADYNQNTRIAHYIGHVSVHQGTTQIQADEITTYSDQSNKITLVIATGNPATYQTIREVNKPPLIAKALKIQYDPIKKQVVLIGNASVMQGKNLMTSTKIFYDIAQQNVQTFPDPKQQTKIVFQPDAVQTAKKQEKRRAF